MDNREAKFLDYIDQSRVAACGGAGIFAQDTVLRGHLWGFHNDNKEQQAHDKFVVRFSTSKSRESDISRFGRLTC